MSTRHVSGPLTLALAGGGALELIGGVADGQGVLDQHVGLGVREEVVQLEHLWSHPHAVGQTHR